MALTWWGHGPFERLLEVGRWREDADKRVHVELYLGAQGFTKSLKASPGVRNNVRITVLA